MAVDDLGVLLMELAPRDRVELAYQLLDSVDPELIDEYDKEVEAEWAAEIKRRVDEIRDGTAVTYDIEDVLAAMRARYGGEDDDDGMAGDPAVDTVGAAEIKRRLDEYDAGLVEAIPAEDVFDRARTLVRELARKHEPDETREAP
jgi:putative addiction module component (TIGR02574 family)